MLEMFRGSERILIVLLAGFCIYLGYRLFYFLPTSHDSEGRLVLPKASLTFSRVGPGVLFAAVGAFVLIFAVRSPVEFDDRRYYQTPSMPPQSATASEVSVATASEVSRAKAQIETLNCVLQNMPSTSGLLSPARLKTAVHEAKVALIRAIWQPDWGDHLEQEALDFQQFSNEDLREIYEAINPGCPTPEKGAKE